MSNALVGVLVEATDATKRKISIVELKLNDAFLLVSIQTEFSSQADISRIWTELECDDCKALRIVVTCCAVLHNRVGNVGRLQPDTDRPVAGFDEDKVVAEPRPIEGLVLDQAFNGGTETGGTKSL